MAIAPPLTFTFEVSQPRSLLTAQACAANASLASTRSRSSFFQPAFLSAARDAGIGPVPMIAGSTPACAQDTMRASGVLPSLAASLANFLDSEFYFDFEIASSTPPSYLQDAELRRRFAVLETADRSLVSDLVTTPVRRSRTME